MKILRNQGIVTALTLVLTPVYLAFASNFEGSTFYFLPTAIVVNSFAVHFMNSIDNKNEKLFSIIFPLTFAFVLSMLNFIPKEEFSPHYFTYTLWYPYALLSFLVITISIGVLKVVLLFKGDDKSFSHSNQSYPTKGVSPLPLIEDCYDFITLYFPVNKKIHIFNESRTPFDRNIRNDLADSINKINESFMHFKMITSENKKSIAEEDISSMINDLSDIFDNIAEARDVTLVNKINRIHHSS